MRHYVSNKNWKAFYYVGFKNHKNHKTKEEFFLNSELTKYDSKTLERICNNLVEKKLYL